MKKTYIIPNVLVFNIEEEDILAGATSGGVSTNSTLGNVYLNSDESYTNEDRGSGIWDREW